MPFSDLFSSKPAQHPVLQFVGPAPTSGSSLSSLLGGSSGSNGTIFMRDLRSGAMQPTFTVQLSKSKPNVTLARIAPNGSTQLLGTSSRSALSGSITLSVNGQELKIRTDPILGISKTLSIPNVGDFSIKDSSSGSSLRIIDSNKVEIAKYSWSHDQPTLDIFVQGADGFLIEVIVLASIASMHAAKKDAKDAKTAGNVAEAVAGMGA